jgi:hypothetical protein
VTMADTIKGWAATIGSRIERDDGKAVVYRATSGWHAYRQVAPKVIQHVKTKRGETRLFTSAAAAAGFVDQAWPA